MATTTTVRTLRATMLSQLGISITATIAATLILAGAQYELTALRPSAAVPDLTSGGKFAARVEALRAAPDDQLAEMPTPPVPPVPLLAASNTLLSLPMPFDPSTASGANEAVRAPKRVAHVEPHHRAIAGAVDAVAPKRSEAPALAASADMTASSRTDAIGVEASTVWSTTKGIYKQALGIGGTVLDRLNPLNLIP